MISRNYFIGVNTKVKWTHLCRSLECVLFLNGFSVPCLTSSHTSTPNPAIKQQQQQQHAAGLVPGQVHLTLRGSLARSKDARGFPPPQAVIGLADVRDDGDDGW